MKAQIVEQEHRINIKITEVRLSKIQDISVDVVRIKSEFLATQYCKKEMQMIEDVETEVEVCLPFNTPIVYDEIEQDIPFDLWVGLRKAINSPEALAAVNEALLPFSEQFINSLQGFQLQLTSVELG